MRVLQRNQANHKYYFFDTMILVYSWINVMHFINPSEIPLKHRLAMKRERTDCFFFGKNRQSIMASGLMFANLFHVLKLALIVQVLLCSFVLTRPCEVQKQIIGRNLAP